MDSSGTAIYLAPTFSAEAKAHPIGCALFAGDMPPTRTGVVERRSHGNVPDLHPANLLAGHGSGARLIAGEVSNGGRCCWWLAHTLPRQEKAVAAALFARNVPYYLPLVTRKSLSRGRTRVARVSLFPGYVFLYGRDEERLSALKTNRLLTVREAPDGECLRGFGEVLSADCGRRTAVARSAAGRGGASSGQVGAFSWVRRHRITS